MAINLLPTELTPKSSISNISVQLRKVSIYGLVVFIVVLLTGGGYLFFLSGQLRESTVNQEQLKANISSFETTEQSVVLLKDRIKKANLVLAQDNTYSSLPDFRDLYFSLPLGTTMTDAKLAPSKTEVTLLISSSTSLVEVVRNLATLTSYKKIEIASFSFTPTAGYLVSFVLFN